MSRSFHILFVTSVFSLACGGSGNNGPQDLTIPADLVPAPDLSAGRDLASPDLASPDLATPDMATPDMVPPADMLSPLVLTGLPTCAAATVTADTLYSSVFGNTCAVCHANGAGGVMITSGATLRSMWVDKVFQNARVPVVKSGGGDSAVNNSYIMYKLMDQAAVAGGSVTDRMPKGGDQLSDANLCLFINWIKGGAP